MTGDKNAEEKHIRTTKPSMSIIKLRLCCHDLTVSAAELSSSLNLLSVLDDKPWWSRHSAGPPTESKSLARLAAAAVGGEHTGWSMSVMPPLLLTSLSS